MYPAISLSFGTIHVCDIRFVRAIGRGTNRGTRNLVASRVEERVGRACMDPCQIRHALLLLTFILVGKAAAGGRGREF